MIYVSIWSNNGTVVLRYVNEIIMPPFTDAEALFPFRKTYLESDQADVFKSSAGYKMSILYSQNLVLMISQHLALTLNINFTYTAQIRLSKFKELSLKLQLQLKAININLFSESKLISDTLQYHIQSSILNYSYNKILAALPGQLMKSEFIDL